MNSANAHKQVLVGGSWLEPGMQTYVIDNLTAGTWYFAIVAVTNTGAQSARPNVVTKTIG